MDEALSSSRHGGADSGSSSHRGDYNHRYNSGGGGVNRRGGYHNNHSRRYQPYNRHDRGGSNRRNYHGGGGYRVRGGRGRGYYNNNRQRQPANRFDTSSNSYNTNNETKSIDPQLAMLKQLSAMVAKMSDLLECAKNVSTSTEDQHDEGKGGERGVVKAVARNIQDLIGVLCSEQNAPMFLKYQQCQQKQEQATTSIHAEEEAGPLATLITSCAATLPLQSPSYVGLTFGIEEHAPDSVVTVRYTNNKMSMEDESPNSYNDTNEEREEVISYKGFAERCVTMACRRVATDLDKVGGVTFLLENTETDLSSSSSSSSSISGDNFVDAFMRCKLLLRYFALLAKVGIISGYDEQNDSTSLSTHQYDIQNDDTLMNTMTVAGLLKLFVFTATKASNEASSLSSSSSKATCESFHNISFLFCSLVLSTLPYTLTYIPQSFTEFLVMNIDCLLSKSNYQSNFQPGSGIMSMLLEKEIHEVNNFDEDGSENDDDNKDDDDDDDDDATPPCADTLQDLFRTVRKVMESCYHDSSSSNVGTRFSLLSDSPWLCLQGKEQEYAPMEGDEEDAMLKQKNAFRKLEFNGEPILISLETSVLFSYLLSLDGNSNISDISMENGVSISKTVALQCPSLEGVIFGRISIFDSPPEDEEENDSDDDNEAENPNLAAYVKTFSLVDRYFLSEAVRDCLICHKSSVSPSGLEKGSCKEVAEQIWALSHIFHPATDNVNGGIGQENRIIGIGDTEVSPAKGVEYGIVETILSLIIQAPRNIHSTSPLSHVYLSRVLIELAKFQPSLVPQSLAIAVAALFNDFIPSLSPLATENFAQWLAFHLTNTDYQWPNAYWNLWTPYVTQSRNDSKRNCRGEFVLNTIQCMASTLSNPGLLLKECLPAQSELSNYILGRARSNIVTKSKVLDDSEKDLVYRIWIQNEDPEVIREYIIGDEISESVQNDLDDVGDNSVPDQIWWRTGLIIRSILIPAVRDNQRLERLIEETKGIDMVDSSVNDDWDPKDDVLTDIGDIIPRYKTVILATIAQDIKVHEENLDLRGESKKSESDMILSGETFVLRQCECLLSYSCVILRECVDALISNEILSPKAVVHWSIGSSNDTSDAANPISSGWWNYALSASQLGLNKYLSNNGSNSDMFSSDVGMIIDTGEDEEDDPKAATPSIRRMKLASDYIKPLLKFTSNRVTSLLESDNSSGLLSHECADLKEGLKYFTRGLLSHVKVTLKEDLIVNATTELGGASLEVETFMGASNLSM